MRRRFRQYAGANLFSEKSFSGILTDGAAHAISTVPAAIVPPALFGKDTEMLAKIDVAATVDRIGVLKAQIAELENQEKAERAILVAQGAGAYDGAVFRATVSESDRATIDWRAIAETLKPSLKMPREYWSEQVTALVDGHTITKPVTTVRVVARKAA